MIQKLRQIAAGAALAVGLATAPTVATAADVITNGAFTTNLAGWTFVDISGLGFCSYAQAPGPTAGMTGGHARADAIATSDCGLYQQVTLAPGTTNTLTVNLGSSSNGTNALDVHALQIRDTSNVVLQTLYTFNGTGGASDPAAARGPYNLNAYAGQTIRVFFFTHHQSNPFNQVIDNVVLDSTPAATVPTMSEWAMLLMGLLLAGGAVLAIQRRRTAA